MPRKDYEDQVQIQVRKLLNRAMVETFDLFTFEYDAVLEKYFPHLPMAHDACIGKVIGIVKAAQVQCVIEMNAEVAKIQNTNPMLAAKKRNLVTRFTDTCAWISNEYIARMLLNAISMYQVGKNWNSYGSLLGATLCQMALMLSCLDSASKGSVIDCDFTQLIPQGNAQTGHKHGHHDVSYVEYMTSGKEKSLVTSADALYLDHMKFRSEHHDQKVHDIMNRELPNIKAVVPRPMRAHTFDFNLTFKDACLLDGECKLTESQHEKAILVFHSLDQLAFKDKALALLTTSDSFTFYSSWIVDGAAYIQTCYHELRKFKIGPITKIDEDEDKNAEHWKLPLTFTINGNADFVETDENVLKVWGKLWSEIRGFIGVMLRAVDIMCEALSDMDINAISQNHHAAYNSGWGEPKFTAGDISELKSRRHVENQEESIYCRKMMEDEDTADHQARANQQLYEGFKEIWDSGVPMSAELRAAIEFGMNCHKSPDV